MPPRPRLSTLVPPAWRRATKFRFLHTTSNRIQVFRKDGTFVKEAFVSKRTLLRGAASGFALSSDGSQRFLYMLDGANHHVWILERQSLRVIARSASRDCSADRSMCHTPLPATAAATSTSARISTPGVSSAFCPKDSVLPRLAHPADHHRQVITYLFFWCCRRRPKSRMRVELWLRNRIWRLVRFVGLV